MTIKLTALLLTLSFLIVGHAMNRYDDEVIEHEFFVFQSDLSIRLHPQAPEVLLSRAHYLNQSGRHAEMLRMVRHYKRVASRQSQQSRANELLFLESQAHSLLGHEKEASKLRTELYYREQAAKRSKQ